MQVPIYKPNPASSNISTKANLEVSKLRAGIRGSYVTSVNQELIRQNKKGTVEDTNISIGVNK